jgi:hypothetical protein
MFIPALCLRARPCSLRRSRTLIASFSSTFPSQLAILTARHGSHVRQSKRSRVLHVASRSARTRASVRVEDLPQGAIPLDSTPLENNAPAYPTVVLQARANMRKFDNCVLLTRVGGFYELYFEQAEEFGPLLNLKVAQKKTNAGPVSMVRSCVCLLSL